MDELPIEIDPDIRDYNHDCLDDLTTNSTLIRLVPSLVLGRWMLVDSDAKRTEQLLRNILTSSFPGLRKLRP